MAKNLENDLKATNNETESHEILHIAEILYSVSGKIEQFAREYFQFEDRT